MNIGQAAAASGVSARMIRYYERIGVIARPRRARNGYRVYGDADVHTLRFVRRARDLGFSIERIRRLVGLWRNPRRSSAEVKAIALDHVAGLKRRIAELEAMAAALEHLARHCHGDQRPECPILEDLEADRPRADAEGGARAAPDPGAVASRPRARGAGAVPR